MGKKNKKQTKIETDKKLSSQKRNELNSLIESILNLGFKQANNPTEMWNQYSDLQSLLERVIEIENSIKLKSFYDDENKSRSSKIEIFSEWAKIHGASFEKVKISTFDGFDFGLEALAQVQKGETFITIPRKLMMSESTIPKNDICNNIPFFDTMSNVKLAFLLLLERLNESSFWKPFVDILPKQYSTVMYFNFEEMLELKGSNCFFNALNQCKSIARQYAFIYKCIQSSKADDLLKKMFCYDLYRWAVSTVMTRQNFIPHCPENNTGNNTKDVIPALIPLWDMANHKDGEVTSSYNIDLDQLESCAVSNFNIGEQIFIYYGNRSNADLLIHNGFIYPDNSADSVSIRIGLGKHDDLYQEKTNLLDKLDISNNCELKVLRSPKYISRQLLAFVRVFHMNKTELEHWINTERTQDLLHIDCALNTELDRKTWQFIENRLNILLKIFPTTLEEDEKILLCYTNRKINLGNIKLMLLQYRILEKRILFDALDYAKKRTTV